MTTLDSYIIEARNELEKILFSLNKCDKENKAVAAALLTETERLRSQIKLHEALSAGEPDLRDENERLRASNRRLEIEAIQRQGDHDCMRLAAKAEIVVIRNSIAELEQLATDAYLQLCGSVQ